MSIPIQRGKEIISLLCVCAKEDLEEKNIRFVAPTLHKIFCKMMQLCNLEVDLPK